MIKFILISVVLLAAYNTISAFGIQRYDRDFEENEYCGLDPVIYNGRCKKIKSCMNLLAAKRNIEICSFGYNNRGDDTLVCCSREDFFKSRTLSRKGPLDMNTCMEKYKSFRSFDSGELSAFVINGVDVKPMEFAHIAAIGWVRWSDFSIGWNCAGSLITETHVASAAHCMLYNGIPPNVVRLGDIDLNSNADDDYIQQFTISNIIRHPEYSSITNQNDIAIIRIQGQVFPTKEVVPACVNKGPLATEYFEGAGYGQNENGIHTNKLSKVQLKFIEMDTCQESYDMPLSTMTQLCAKGYRDDIEPQDLCYGDSGSALQYMNTDLKENGGFYKIPTLVAITSFGIGCAFGFPSVYVNITNYVDWMESVIETEGLQ